MKYSQNYVWQAVYTFCPELKVARTVDKGIQIVESLKNAAVESFLQDDISNFNNRLSVNIIKIALKELKNNGMINFGDIEEGF